MNVRKILLITLLFGAQSIVFAARMTVYNLSRWTQEVSIYTGSGNLSKLTDSAVIYPRDKKTFITFNPFVSMEWQVHWQEGDDNADRTQYRAFIPSSVSMLTGTINLFGLGTYGINFDQNGRLPGDRIVSKKGELAFPSPQQKPQFFSPEQVGIK